ncbi:MAG TPA: hypothetical protein VK699_02195 [Terriglobales bacterium]|jgi:hypothetical protein|nr:hypothetical protein [Terriglobales bacterium]
MKVAGCAALLISVLFLCAGAQSATPGEFRGHIVNSADAPDSTFYIYVLGQNHRVRKVAIQKAEVVYASEVPVPERKPHPTASLIEGAEVRVTAIQGTNGSWEARRVEILHTAPVKIDARSGKI